MRVLHVISNFGIGGAEVWLIALLRCFKDYASELGVELETDVFITNGVKDMLDDEARSLGARLIYARYSRRTLPSFVQTWRQTLREGNYIAVHDHQEFTAGWHLLFGIGLLPPVRIVHLHNPMSHQVSYGSSYIRRKTISLGNRWVANLASHLLSTSDKLIAEQGFYEFRAARDLPKNAVHCGFEVRRFSGSRDEAKSQVLAELGLNPTAKIMLFVGRLDSHRDEALNQKNPAFCIEVARKCAELDDRIVCLMAGSGASMIDTLRKRIADWGLGNRIILLGPRSDVPRLMLGTDILIFPSLAEGLGMVAVEAQAAGLPVIASDTVPRECMVVDGAVDFQPLSAGALHWAKAILRKLDEPYLPHALMNQAVAESPFSILNSAKELVDIYCGGTATRERAS